MGAKRATRWGAAGIAGAGALLLLTGCGGKDVTFTPAANTSAIVQPAGGGGGAGGGGVTTPPDVQITDQGSTICVRNKRTGSQACVGKHGTAVVDGIVIVDGKVVATSGSSGDVSINGGNVVSGDGVASAATSGQVTLSGAVQWRGTARGTCQRQGDVRHAQVGVGDGGTLEIDAVGGGVVRIALRSGGDEYAGNWVGESGVVSLAAKSLTVHGAGLGRGSATVRVDATLDC